MNRFSTDYIVPFSKIKDIERTKENQHGEFIRAYIARTDTLGQYTIEVNKQEEAWHYPWNPARRASKIPHHVKLYVFQKIGEHAVCLGCFHSNPFRITCKRNNEKDSCDDIQSNPIDQEEEDGENGKELNANKRKSNVDSLELEKAKISKKPRKQPSNNKNKKKKNLHDSSLSDIDNIPEFKRKLAENKKYDSFGELVDDDEEQEAYPVTNQTRPHFLVTLLRALYSDVMLGSDAYQPELHDDILPNVFDSSDFQRVMKCTPGLHKFTTILLGEVLSGKEADFHQIYSDSFDCHNSNQQSTKEKPNNEAAETQKETIEYSANIARDLSNYLQNDDIFTKQLSDFAKSCKDVKSQDNNIEEYVNKFFNIVIEHVKGFLATRNISLDRLEEKLSIGKHAFPLSINNASNDVESNSISQKQTQAIKDEFVKRIKKNPFADVFNENIPRLTEPEFDLEGTWVYIGEENAATIVVNELNARGFPGFLLYFIRKSLVKLTIDINRDWLYFKGPDKLADDLQYLFSLNGKEHSWILPQYISLSSPVRSLKYTACVDYEKKCIRIEHYGIYLSAKNQMISVTREFQASPDGIEMYSKSSFYVQDLSKGVKEWIGDIDSVFLRVWRNDDALNLVEQNNS